MFADDTVIVKGTDMQSAYDHMNMMNVALNGLSDWCKANQLSANPTKTKYTHFGCRNIVVPVYLRLSMDGELLERVPSTKFLGMFIDEQLTWEYHIKHWQKRYHRECRCDIPWNTGSAGTLYTLISPLYLRDLVRCDVVRCQGILV